MDICSLCPLEDIASEYWYLAFSAVGCCWEVRLVGALGRIHCSPWGSRCPKTDREMNGQTDRQTEGFFPVLGWPPCSVGAELSDPEPSFLLAADLQRLGCKPFLLPVSWPLKQEYWKSAGGRAFHQYNIHLGKTEDQGSFSSTGRMH